MKIADIAMGKSVLEQLADKKRSQKVSPDSPTSVRNNVDKDIFEANKKISTDVSRINEIQKGFMKDLTSMSGLSALQNKIESFEKTGQKNFEQLSQDMKSIVASTKFDGESVISYLSTNVYDEKSLYTFKSSLNNEISNIRSKIAEERKNIASYLVKSENLESVGDFSSEKTLNNVVATLDKQNIHSLYKGIRNANTLLGIEK